MSLCRPSAGGLSACLTDDDCARAQLLLVIKAFNGSLFMWEGKVDEGYWWFQGADGGGGGGEL